MYIVTGVSGGIGEAIVRKYLEKGERVIGIGRRCSIQHPLFRFVKCDLSDSAEIKALNFAPVTGNVTLINNAGILGNIGRLSDLPESDISEVLQINVTAAVILTQKVYASMMDPDRFTLVNISSGAALRPIPSWLAYCTSKAALNMFSETFYAEEQEKGRNIRVYAVAPGVVDTRMQDQIREAPESSFSNVQRFRDLKSNDELFSPQEVADRLDALLAIPFDGQVVTDLRSR